MAKNKKQLKKEKPIFSWEIKIKTKEKSALYFTFWFLAMVAFAALFVLVLANILGAIAIFVVIIVYLYFSQKIPKIKKINLYRSGIKYEDHLYPFREILFFKEIEIKDKKFLILFTNSRLMPEISFEMPYQGKDKILHLFFKHIPILNQKIFLSNLHLDSYIGA